MKPRLMHRDRDFDPDRKRLRRESDLIQDLELTTLWDAMAKEDKLVRTLVPVAMLDPLTDAEAIRHRQGVVVDCLKNPETVRELYSLANEGVEAERSVFRSYFSDRPAPLLDRSVRVLEVLFEILHRLRDLGTREAPNFTSVGFTALFATLATELDDAYLRAVDAHLQQLHFPHGIVMSAHLGAGNKGIDYTLRQPRAENHTLLGRPALRKPTFSFTIPERDDAGYRALSDLRDRGLDEVANAAGQSSDHVRNFFIALRNELAFYVGCINLAAALARLNVPVSFPAVQPPDSLALSARQLREPCLALRLDSSVVGTDFDADGDGLILITGANQGGKSTFLRSLGLAHLMMQSGMFVAAERFSATPATSVFTHYKREEDETMASGKLDEELARMSTIVDKVEPGGLLLCNESFAATNEREGSDIAIEVIAALVDTGVRVAYVTHLHDLAHRMYESRANGSLFLRAERKEGGERSFRLSPGKPLETSYGEDLYAQIFTAQTSGRQPP
jgi:hypothetical protein